MNPMKVMILDDEIDAVNLLLLKMEKLCPHVQVIGAFQKTDDAFEMLQFQEPDLLFIDIEMPGMNGFEFLHKIKDIKFSVVFVTAFEQYALKAIKFNALDYLTKPFEDQDLILAVERAGQKIALHQDQIKGAKQMASNKLIEKIAVSSQNGICFIDLDEILYAESNNNYSVLSLKNNRQFTVSKTLKDLQDVLEETHFMRVHRQYIINLNYVKQFNKTNSEITMLDNKQIPVARTLKDKLLEMYRGL